MNSYFIKQGIKHQLGNRKLTNVCFKDCCSIGILLLFTGAVQKDLYAAFVPVGLLPPSNGLCLFYSIILISVIIMDCPDMNN